MEQTQTLHERLLVDREHRYLSLICRFLDGQTDATSFRRSLRSHWYEERDALWRAASLASRRDFRPLPRLLDRLDAVPPVNGDPNGLRRQALNLLDEYRAAKAGHAASVIAAPPRLPLFESPLPEGWVYPCTLEDIRQRLALVPEQELEGLRAVGLALPELEDRGHYGTYFFAHWRKPTPVIYLHARPQSLSFRTKRTYSIGQAERRYAVELSYGMRIEVVGRRLLCRWEPECLRRFVAEHVLLHEVGHHLQRQQRLLAGHSPFPGYRACEQFAEDYALRKNRKSSHRLPSLW